MLPPEFGQRDGDVLGSCQTTLKTEQKYSVGELEALACVWASFDTADKPPGPHSPACYIWVGTQTTEDSQLVREAPTIQLLHAVTPGRDNVTSSLHQPKTPRSHSSKPSSERVGPSKVQEELVPFNHVRDEPSCWKDVCVARGLCTAVLSILRARTLSIAHKGNLGSVKTPTPWEHIQVDICSKLHVVPQHQRFIIVAYDLHSGVDWPSGIPGIVPVGR
ncbi:unnamed protein product [Pleuronectes platessa]|uniref:Uncharacterized protein n=1 Tax=Pleuronectes platessa TaxID=8262 RepID=A0A9N7TVQ8_PLEPL|nr:unnamed protein product [Pleuronectes platessa]